MQKKMRKPISLFIIITLIISICMITPCIMVGIYFYLTLRDNTLDSIEQNLDTSAERAIASLDSTLHSVKNTYYSIISDPVINPELYNYIVSENSPSSISGREEGMASGGLSEGRKVSFSESIDERLTKMMFYSTIWNENVLTSITLTNDLRTYHYISNTKYGAHLDQENSSSLDSVTQNWEQFSKTLGTDRIHILCHSPKQTDSVLYIRDYYGYPDGAFKGLIGFQLSEQALMSVFRDFEKYTNTICFAFDESGAVIMSNHPDIRGGSITSLSIEDVSLKEILDESGNYLVKTVSLNNAPLTACVLIPLEPVYQELRSQLRGYFILFLLLLSAVILIALMVSRRVSSYIDLLIRRMTSLSSQNCSLTLPEYGITELDHLSVAFTDMSQQIQRLLKEKYANEVLLKESELKALQAQINPHFLFNTLLSISWKARSNQDMECYEMITALSSLLNANIYTPATRMIPLQEELQNVRNYLLIQKIRFGPKISYDIDVDTRLMKKPILKLCLQPLVENAVVHGLENKVEDGSILITGDMAGEREMLIRVIDNGVGFNPDELNLQLDAQESDPAAVPEGGGHHIGLLNTHLRIKYTYGKAYGITIDSAPGKGTTISVRLPLSHEEL